jgi:4Fe-4S ferredoxin
MPVPEIAMKPVEGTNQVKYIKRFLITKTELYYDPDKCINCELCLQTCPKEAIEAIPDGDPKLGPGPVGVDLDKCILCGICSWICSTGAFNLKVDDEPRLMLRENESLPGLLPIMLKSKDGKDVKKILEGSIRILVEKCPKDCKICVDSCPMDVISFTSLKKDRKVTLNQDNCIKCFSCKRDCPVEDAILIERSRFFWNEKDEFSSPFVEIIYKLMGATAKTKFLRDYSLRQINERGMDLYRSELMEETK